MNKFVFKIAIDFSMAVLLLLIMSFQSTGQMLHEYFGVALTILFITHNILNLSWYKNIFKGRYNKKRAFQTCVNAVMIVFMAMAVISGIAMSGYAFSFLNIGISTGTARKLHLFSVYWAFVFMSLHLGIHSQMLLALTKRINISKLILKIIAFVLAIFGAYVFYNNNLFSYMFLQSEFAFFDFGKNIFIVLIENIGLMTFWALMAHYILKLISKK